MAQHRSVSEFHPSNEDWVSYTEHVQHYFTANNVMMEEKKCSIFLSNCGVTTYKLIWSLVDADRFNPTSYKDLVKLVQEYYAPPPSVIVQRFKFNSLVRSYGWVSCSLCGIPLPVSTTLRVWGIAAWNSLWPARL